ncbi:type I secretion system permease/ATPase [Hyphomicrobium sp.]|uniref:type I secretion system permease/ATPase n=1 Tax=Hyphomicrobium sp. TaxID=82 RepID=UPI003F6FA34E
MFFKAAPPTIKKELRLTRAAFIGVGIFSGVINVLALTGSMYMLQVYDRVLPSRSVPTLIGLTVLLVILYIAFGLLDYVRIRILTRVGVELDRKLRRRVLDAVLLLPLRTRQGGDALQPVRDLDQVRAFLSSVGPTALFDMPWLPVYLALVYILHPVMGLFALWGAVMLVTLAALTEYRTRAPAEATAKSSGARLAFGLAAQRNAEVVKAMGFDRQVAMRWNRINERYLGDHLGMSDVSNSLGALSRVMRLLLQSGMLGLGGYLAIHDQVSGGAIIAGSIVMARALAPIELAIAHWRGFALMRISAKRLDGILAQVPTTATSTGLPAPTKMLSVEGIAIAPPGEQMPTLTNIAFALRAGDGVGVIGPSGSGKSTLVRGLAGVWPTLPRAGSVRLDGATLDQWSSEEIGRHVGYLPQDIELFEGTIGENIARLDADAAGETIVRAGQLSGAHDMIVRLPEGYATPIGEGGLKLSAGQRQLVGLARALYGDPFLVILDEPNSNLDAKGDEGLTRAIVGVRERGGIVVVVAHRASALASLNMVLALSDGQQVAFGAKEEVLARITKPPPLIAHATQQGNALKVVQSGLGNTP